MKNHWSFFLFWSCLFFSACVEPSQNEHAKTDETDTAFLIALNDQTLIPDTQATTIIKQENLPIEVKKNQPGSTSKIQVNVETNLISREVDEGMVGDAGMTGDLVIRNVETDEIKSSNAPTETTAFSHEKWDQLLRKYVSASGKVNYKGIKAEQAALDAYLKYLENNPVQGNWSKAKKMAYWINAYNAFTIKMIVDNYPVSSITRLHGGKPWDVKWIKLNGQSLTLNNIENDILRPEFKDARIHFAVNCAAQSCPPILNEAWTESNLEQMLEKQAKAFINNPKFNTIKSNEIEISRIFEWYAVDFGNIVDYLNQYSNTKINKNAKVKYKEYDWNLNE